MKRKYIFIVIAVLLVVLVVFRLMHNKKALDENKNTVQTTATFIPVKVDTARKSLHEVNIMKTGNVAPFVESKIIAGASGALLQLKFNLGSIVRQGQTLAVLDTRLLQIDLAKEEETAAKAKHDLDTYTDLLQGKAATQETVDSKRIDYTNAINAVERTKRQIMETAVLAPINGMISDKKVEQGVYINSGTEMGTVVNVDRSKVDVNLTEAEVYQVHLGQDVSIKADVFPGKTFAGKISFISPQADITHNYKVEIIVKNGANTFLRSGTLVYVDFSKKTEESILLIPQEALVAGNQGATVFTADSSIAHQRTIQTGRQVGEQIEVISGLKAGELVIVSGQINLKEGTPIRISK